MKSLIVIISGLMFCISCGSQKSNVENTSGETIQGRSQGPPSIEEVFKMDTNADGKLAESEVNGRLKRDFSKIDSNRDGFITREEFENAPKPQRGQRPQRTN